MASEAAAVETALSGRGELHHWQEEEEERLWSLRLGGLRFETARRRGRCGEWWVRWRVERVVRGVAHGVKANVSLGHVASLSLRRRFETVCFVGFSKFRGLQNDAF